MISQSSPLNFKEAINDLVQAYQTDHTKVRSKPLVGILQTALSQTKQPVLVLDSVSFDPVSFCLFVFHFHLTLESL